MVSQPEKITARELLYSGRPLRNWLVIFSIALISRILFLTYAPQLPVFWDARIYVSAAVGILGYIDQETAFAGGDTGVPEYSREYMRHIHGEDINWLYYKPPTLSEAQKYIFYSGPVYPAIMAAIIALPWGHDFQAVRLFNAVVDSLSIVFLCMLAFLLWRKSWIVWVTAALQLLYLPLIITCGILGLETITSFFVSIFLLMLGLFYHTEERRYIILAGLIGGLLFLCKPTASLLTAPAFFFLFLVYFRNRAFLVRALGLYLIPFLILVIPWIIFTSTYYGSLSIRDPEYATANFRSSSAIEFEGYDLDKSDADFWTYPVAQRIIEKPLGYINLLSKKFIRLWWTPHDEFWQAPRRGESIYHRLLILASLLGIAAIPLMKNRLLFLLLFLGLYYTGIHVILHSVPRYNFNALPAVFILATAGIVFIAGQRKWIRRQKRLLLGGTATVIALLAINQNYISRYEATILTAYIPLAVTILLLAGLGALTMKLLRPDYKSRWQKLFFWIPIAALCLTSITGWTRPDLGRQETAISESGIRLVTEISLPQTFRMTPRDEIRLAIDITSDPREETPVTVDINGLTLDFVDGRPPVDNYFYIKGTYGAFETYMGFDRRGERWYRIIKLEPEQLAALLGPDPSLTISIGIADSLYRGTGLALSSYPQDTALNSLDIPSLSHNSIERFKELGDRRIYEPYMLSSDSGVSYILSSDGSRDDDLSPMPGIQKGRFGVILHIKRPDFSQQYY